MTQQQGDMTSATATVRRRVKELRERQGLTTHELARRCASLGLERLTRDVLTSIELGGARRQSVSVDELLGLALALGVSPIHLLLGSNDDVLVIGNDRIEAPFFWLVGAMSIDPARKELWDKTHPDPAASVAHITQQLVAFERLQRALRQQAEAVADVGQQLIDRGMTTPTPKKGGRSGKRPSAT
jgi:transcriptional regulator with XRE-family HTH domain